MRCIVEGCHEIGAEFFMVSFVPVAIVCAAHNREILTNPRDWVFESRLWQPPVIRRVVPV